MDLATKLASDITVFSKYAKFIHELGRRETWDEIVSRYEDMMTKKYPKQTENIVVACGMVRHKKILPSMRFLQFAGKAIERGNSRGYNCGYCAASYPQFFRELMFLLLGGSGIGYSVQSHHVEKLPAIKKPSRGKKFLIADNIEGWADAVHALFRAYFNGKNFPIFDFSDIRKKGEPLRVAGGKAPGAGPLRVCLSRVAALLEGKEEGSKLETSEVSDIACYIADAVLSGGIRRAAMIALFDIGDQRMLKYKSGDWYVLHPERARVNVSAVALRSAVDLTQFFDFWQVVANSGAGEPGILWSNDAEVGTNPCCEISLRHKQFCNLTTINFSSVKDEADFQERVKWATFLGTLQAGFTEFHYLTDGWESNCEEEALLGVSITGICDKGSYRKFDFTKMASYAKRVNKRVADELGIRPAARITTNKPEGSASLVLGTSSGIHGRHSEFYIRRFRFNKNEPIAIYLQNKIPALVAQDQFNPDGVILELPQKSPSHSILRHEPVLDLLERAKFFNEEWIRPGHTSGPNPHNASCTVSVKPNDWSFVGKWMWDNKGSYSGISVLPFAEHTYVQAPFEECTKEKYEEMMTHLEKVDLSEVKENDDTTDLKGELACAGGKCEIP